jgi:hypothetical protein
MTTFGGSRVILSVPVVCVSVTLKRRLQLARNFSLHFDLMIQERYDGVAMMLQW